MRRARTSLTAASAVLLLAVTAIMTSGGVGSAGADRHPGAFELRVPALPRLGPIQTVDQNDVGDPFILPVGAGVPPPTGFPYLTTGPDAYQSSAWTAATAAQAVEHGWYVLFGTTDWQENVPTAISTDLVHWTQAPDSLPVLPGWAAPSISMTWAPAAQQTGTGWVLYYSTEEAASGLECIGRALSSTPTGPYRDKSSSPMLCQRRLGGSIDPSVVKARRGATFLVWKNDGNAVHAPDSIWAQQVSADGLSLTGAPYRLLGADEAWQKGIIEAPAMIAARAGGYWLFYAGGDWNSNAYGTGLAYCRTVTGPCVETSAHPFLVTDASVISPGGLDIVTDGRGRLWAEFTALVLVPSTSHPGRYYYNRVLDIAPIFSR
jgi:beta-xylosidase